MKKEIVISFDELQESMIEDIEQMQAQLEDVKSTVKQGIPLDKTQVALLDKLDMFYTLGKSLKEVDNKKKVERAKMQVEAFRKACLTMVEEYDMGNELMVNFVNECYPFAESLDEMTNSLSTWATKEDDRE